MDEARRAGEERRAAQEQARVAQEQARAAQDQARAAEERENAALAELADMAGDNMYVVERNRLGGNVSTDLWRKLCIVPSSTYVMRARSNDWYSQELPVSGSREHAQVLFIDPSDDGQTHWLQQVEKIPQQEGAATTVPPKLSVLEALPVLPSMVEEEEEEASRVCLRPHPRRESAAVKDPPMGLGRLWELQQLVRGDPQKGLPLLLDLQEILALSHILITQGTQLGEQWVLGYVAQYFRLVGDQI